MLLLLRLGLVSASKLSPLFRLAIPSLVSATLLVLGVEGRAGEWEWDTGVLGVTFGGLPRRGLVDDEVTDNNCGERQRTN